MDEIPVSKFKAHCAEVLGDVARTGKSVTITNRGKPIAELGPPSASKSTRRRLGYMAGELGIEGDIVGPLHTLEAVETLREWDQLKASARQVKRKKSQRAPAA